MAEVARGICPVCETEQALKKDGTLYKHGECVGAGRTPAVDPLSEEADDGLDWRDDVPPAETSSTDVELALVGESRQIEPLPPLPPVPEGPIRDFGGAMAYAWQMEVGSPAIYLGDAGWHGENGKMAVLRVSQAGYTVTGEPQWDGVVGGGSTPGSVLLTYLVPVAG